jgi:hypothetical protein
MSAGTPRTVGAKNRPPEDPGAELGRLAEERATTKGIKLSEAFDELKRERPDLLTKRIRQPTHLPAERPMWILWPESLPAHGNRSTGAFGNCLLCGTGTWAKYGQTYFCLPCTSEIAREGHAKTLRDLVVAMFDGVAAGIEPDTAVAKFAAAEITRLVDECGPGRARHVIDHAALEWWKKNRRCPWCGQEGVFHEFGEEDR